MLLHSFRHIQGIGPARERSFWAAGCKTWHDLLTGSYDRSLLRISDGLLSFVTEKVRGNLDDLQRGDLSSLASSFRPREHWRFYPHFSDRAVFCDIETTGTDPASCLVTVIGLYAPGEGPRVFIDGCNLDCFPEVVGKYEVLVTFNGSSFDIPFLRRAFADLALPAAHIDLRWLCREVGLTGGLKHIESMIGLSRHDDVSGFSGAEAVVLWQRFLRQRDASALRLLVRYNLEDTVNLEHVLLHCLDCIHQRHSFLDPAPVGEVISSRASMIDPERLVAEACHDGNHS